MNLVKALHFSVLLGPNPGLALLECSPRLMTHKYRNLQSLEMGLAVNGINEKRRGDPHFLDFPVDVDGRYCRCFHSNQSWLYAWCREYFRSSVLYQVFDGASGNGGRESPAEETEEINY